MSSVFIMKCVDREREERPRRDFGDNLEAKNRSRGAPRPRGGRGRMFDQRGKREFDRQSGSDKTYDIHQIKSLKLKQVSQCWLPNQFSFT